MNNNNNNMVNTSEENNSNAVMPRKFQGTLLKFDWNIKEQFFFFLRLKIQN